MSIWLYNDEASIITPQGYVTLSDFLLYLLAGSFAGLLSGVFGIGGGLIFVPTLTYVLHNQGFASADVIHIAIATSLACISLTSIGAMTAHIRYGKIHWRYGQQLSLGLLPGAWIGTYISQNLTGRGLETIFGGFVFLLAVQVLLSYRFKEDHRPERFAPLLLVLSGVMIGSGACVLGISGGALIVPFLNWRGLPLTQAISLSSVTNLVLAVSGAFFYTHQHPSTDLYLPEQNLWGLIYWPAMLGLVIGSVATVRFGVILSQRLPPRLIRLLFITFLVSVGCDFLFF